MRNRFNGVWLVAILIVCGVNNLAPGVAGASEVIVDNSESAFACTWTYKSGIAGAYNGDQHFHAAGNGSCTATWTPNIVQAGNYDVYAWWKSGSNRATNAKYTIYYDGGSQTVVVNQEINSSQWNLLGTFPFAVGTSGNGGAVTTSSTTAVADGTQTGQFLTIKAQSGANTVTIKDGANTAMANDFTLGTGGISDNITFRWDGANWIELCRSTN